MGWLGRRIVGRPKLHGGSLPLCPLCLQIDLGGGHVMEFVMAPNLHWPDTMFSFDHATNVMYTCEPGPQPGGPPGWLPPVAGRRLQPPWLETWGAALACVPPAGALRILQQRKPCPLSAPPTAGDAFGMHFCTEDPFDSELSPLEPHYRRVAALPGTAHSSLHMARFLFVPSSPQQPHT